MTKWFAIFDWDGVIVDSSNQHEEAWHLIAAEKNRPLPEGFFRRSFGMKNEKVITELLGWTNDPADIQSLSLRKEELFRELIGRQKLVPLPGVLTLLTNLKERGVPCAVASSTPWKNIDCVIDLLGVRSFFQALVCAEDVTVGKPDPDVFLKAAAKLGASPECCVVFEDAHVGIEAAKRAGMRVVAVATTHPAETLSDADHVYRWLTEVELEKIRPTLPE
jgi:beta-phosphoglucomutase family hydrolase